MVEMKKKKRHPGRPRATISDNKIIELYCDKELSLREVGLKLGVSHQTIARRLEMLSVPKKRWLNPVEKKVINSG